MYGMKYWVYVKFMDLVMWECFLVVLMLMEEYELYGVYLGGVIEKDG